MWLFSTHPSPFFLKKILLDLEQFSPHILFTVQNWSYICYLRNAPVVSRLTLLKQEGQKEQSVWLWMSVYRESLEKRQGLKDFTKYEMLSLQATLLSQECSFWGQTKLIQGLGKSIHLFSQTNLLSSKHAESPSVWQLRSNSSDFAIKWEWCTRWKVWKRLICVNSPLSVLSSQSSAQQWRDLKGVHRVTWMPFQRAAWQLARTRELCWKMEFWKASPPPEPGRLNLLSSYLLQEPFSPSPANTECNPCPKLGILMLSACLKTQKQQGWFKLLYLEDSSSNAQDWQQWDGNLDWALEIL